MYDVNLKPWELANKMVALKITTQLFSSVGKPGKCTDETNKYPYTVHKVRNVKQKLQNTEIVRKLGGGCQLREKDKIRTIMQEYE